MFIRQTLRNLANTNSFRRGETLYDEGSLNKLRREADAFRATVHGSQPYRVALRLAATGPAFECSCPYNFDGICKHAVALGLAVLDAYGTDLNAAPSPPTRTPAATPATDLATAWAARSEAEKLRFLEQALTKSDDLARQFLGFGTTAAPAVPKSLLAALPQCLTEALETLEFDEEFYQTIQVWEGYDEYDGLQTASAKVLSEALAPFVAELLNLARGGQLAVALRYWATASTAIYQVEEPASDDYNLFDDFGTNVLHRWQADLATAGWPAVLLGAVLPAAELKAALKWLGLYLANPPAMWPGFEASWLPLLLALAAEPAAVPLLPAALKNAHLGPDARARVALQSARTIPNDAAWRTAAETLLPTDPAVAEQLLHFYANQPDPAAHLRTATTAFTTWPDRFAGYVLSNFTAPKAPDLYRAALRHRALANGSLEDFTRLAPLLTPAARAAFLKAATQAATKGQGSVAFAVELLVQEADTAALTDFVLGLEWLHVSPAAHVDLALRRLAEHAPTALPPALETRTRAYLKGRAKAQRGHALYQRLAQWLAAAHTTPRLSEPILRLADELRVEFPTLYGLREALREVGLLPEKPGAALKKPLARRER